MVTRTRTVLLVTLCLVTTALAVQVWAQSLGEAAKAARKSKPSSSSSTKVYDNESLPRSGTVSVVGDASEPPSSAKTEISKSAEGSRKSGQSGQGKDLAAEELRSRTAELKRKILDLEHESNQFENANRVLKAEWEADRSTHSLPLCYGNRDYTSCREADTDTKRKYKAYVQQRDAMQAELEAARKKLAELEEEARKRGVTL